MHLELNREDLRILEMICTAATGEACPGIDAEMEVMERSDTYRTIFQLGHQAVKGTGSRDFHEHGQTH
jgi:hypothetical protein